MSELKKATIYLEPEVHKALKIKAAETEGTISDLVNHFSKILLTVEDVEDVLDFFARKKEPSADFKAFMSKLRKNGTI